MNVKKATDEDQVKKYTINAYRVMMTRKIKGCYVYACNPGLNEYLKRLIRDRSYLNFFLILSL